MQSKTDEEAAVVAGESTGLLADFSHPTYRAGENPQRLANQAQQFGLDRARASRQRRSNMWNEVFHDHTFSAAMMHSVGSLAGLASGLDLDYRRSSPILFAG